MNEDGHAKVLVVTKDPFVKDAATYGFPEGVTTQLVEDGREAHRAMLESPPDAALIDLLTGNAGGYSVSRDMLDDPRLADVPIVMLIERAQDMWLARQARADVIRIKPVETSDLVADVMGLLAVST